MKLATPLRRVLVAFILLQAALAATTPSTPESIAGMVYRERGGLATLRTVWEQTILFRDDGTFRYLTHGSYNTVASRYQLNPLPADGTYRYTKTSATTAQLILSESGGTLRYGLQNDLNELTLSLHFAPTPGISLAEQFTGQVDSAPSLPAYFGFTSRAVLETRPIAVTALRGRVAPGQPLTVGFVVPGLISRSFLIRAVGPSLAQFGVTDAWSDPDYTFYRNGVAQPGDEAHHGDWSGNATATPTLHILAQSVGAFPLSPGSKDAVGVTRLLAPGNYTIVCSPAACDAGGEVLIEIYPLP